MVESHSFNSWWSKSSKKVLGRKLDAIKRLIRHLKDEIIILVEIPLDNPTEYSIEKIRDIIQNLVIHNQTQDYIMLNYKFT